MVSMLLYYIKKHINYNTNTIQIIRFGYLVWIIFTDLIIPLTPFLLHDEDPFNLFSC